MKSWRTLDKKDLMFWKEKIEAAREEDAATQSKIVGDYYTYLIENCHDYRQLAFLVSTNQGLIGKYAENHLRSVTEERGTKITNESRQNLMIDLAYADIVARQNTKGDIISSKTISNYHYSVFKANDLPPKAWAGNLFEAIGPGALMLNQSPVDQHGRNFTVQNINNFIEEAIKTCSIPHTKTAYFLGTALNDGALCKTISTTPLKQTTSFIRKTYNNLHGNPVYLINAKTAQLMAQASVRYHYNQLFQAVEREAATPPVFKGLSKHDLQNMRNEMIGDPLAGHAKIARDMKATPNYRLTNATLHGKALKFIFPTLDPAQEAHIEYARTHRQPMPHALQQSIQYAYTVPGPTPKLATEEAKATAQSALISLKARNIPLSLDSMTTQYAIQAPPVMHKSLPSSSETTTDYKSRFGTWFNIFNSSDQTIDTATLNPKEALDTGLNQDSRSKYELPESTPHHTDNAKGGFRSWFNIFRSSKPACEASTEEVIERQSYTSLDQDNIHSFVPEPLKHPLDATTQSNITTDTPSRSIFSGLFNFFHSPAQPAHTTPSADCFDDMLSGRDLNRDADFYTRDFKLSSSNFVKNFTATDLMFLQAKLSVANENTNFFTENPFHTSDYSFTQHSNSENDPFTKMNDINWHMSGRGGWFN